MTTKRTWKRTRKYKGPTWGWQDSPRGSKVRPWNYPFQPDNWYPAPCPPWKRTPRPPWVPLDHGPDELADIRRALGLETMILPWELDLR